MQLMFFFRSWHMVSSSNWPLQSPGKATAVISSRVTMAALPASPRNGLSHRCALKFESHNCCTPPCEVGKIQLFSGHEKTRCAVLLGILSCPLGFSAFLKVSTTNLGSCSSIWAWSHPTDPTKNTSELQPPWNSFERLDRWRISHRKFSHLVLLSRLQVWGLNFSSSEKRPWHWEVSGLHMILREVPQLIWTMAHCQGLFLFSMAEQTGTKRSAIEAYFANMEYGIKHIAFCCSGCVNTQPANPELKFLSERTVGCRSSSWRPHFHATLASVQNG